MSEFWTGLWTLVLSAGLFLFSALAVIVSISGMIQLRKLVRPLSGKHPRAAADATPAGQGDESDTGDGSDSDAVT